ncbi:SGNH/GDSL hydrolase family protein [Kaistia granuli]|uniref:SGNH/GDSL hydrolase family protein n=1 Tax=Kaistia granuli TaxID=363259 RepID=UPI0003683A8B|nr:SGNH family hydrolase [Kaistia granuli]
MLVRLFRAFAVVVLVSFAFVGIVEPASAQFRGGPAGFLDRLFGIERPPPQDIPQSEFGGRRAVPGQRIPRPDQPRKKRPAAPAEPVYPALEIQPKNPDAKKVLVVGDFVAGGLAWGLDQAFAEEPRLAVIDRSDGPSGFVRDDHFDWAGKISEVLVAEKPDMVVVLLGTNDRQQIKTKDGRFAPRSDEWQKAYQQRVERFLLALQTYGKPVYWVGVPPMRSKDASADMAFLNTLFKGRVEAVGGRFIDVWDGFADENGKFVARGPDIEGQTRTLRGSDGINFTKSGRRKLAFFVERDIRQDSGFGLPMSSVTPTNPNATMEIGPDGKERQVGPVISLTDPEPGADGKLIGATDQATPGPAADSDQYKLTVEGKSPAAQPGRIDDFAWKPPHADDESAEAPGSIVDGIVILPAPTAGVPELGPALR